MDSYETDLFDRLGTIINHDHLGLGDALDQMLLDYVAGRLSREIQGLVPVPVPSGYEVVLANVNPTIRRCQMGSLFGVDPHRTRTIVLRAGVRAADSLLRQFENIEDHDQQISVSIERRDEPHHLRLGWMFTMGLRPYGLTSRFVDIEEELR